MKIRLEIKDDVYQLILNSDSDLFIGLLSFGYDTAEGFKFGLGKFYESFDIVANKDVILDEGPIIELDSFITFYLDVILEKSIETYSFEMPKKEGDVNIIARDTILEIPVFENGYFIKKIFQDSEHTIEVTFECDGQEYSFAILDEGGYYVDEDLKKILESEKLSIVADAVDDINDWVDFDYWCASIIGPVDEDESSSKDVPSKD